MRKKYTLQDYLDIRTEEEKITIEESDKRLRSTLSMNCARQEIDSLEIDYPLDNIINLRCGINNLTSLKGILNFPNLEFLICSDNELPLMRHLNTSNIHLISDINKLNNLKKVFYTTESNYSGCNDIKELKKIITLLTRKNKIESILK